MANVNIKEVSGGAKTWFNALDAFLLDDGTTSTYILATDLLGKMSEGMMLNGKISVTVATNDITVALKTKSGSDPSTTEPVYVMINGTLRACTAALSKTLNDGTGWFGLDTRFAALEQDFFVYLIWNTSPATDIVDLGFARDPNFKVYSDASSTSTNDKYLATSNASAPNSTDDMVVIGRFAATLSATASFNWSVPTFTSANLIQRPIYETRDLSFNMVGSGFTLGNGTVTAKYKRRYSDITGHFEFVLGNTSAITGDVLLTPPITQGTYGAVSEPVGVNRLVAAGSGYAGATLAASTTSFRVAVYVASGTYLTAAVLSSTVPATWTTNDVISFPFSYIGA